MFLFRLFYEDSQHICLTQPTLFDMFLICAAITRFMVTTCSINCVHLCAEPLLMRHIHNFGKEIQEQHNRSVMIQLVYLWCCQWFQCELTIFTARKIIKFCRTLIKALQQLHGLKSLVYIKAIAPQGAKFISILEIKCALVITHSYLID